MNNLNGMTTNEQIEYLSRLLEEALYYLDNIPDALTLATKIGEVLHGEDDQA